MGMTMPGWYACPRSREMLPELIARHLYYIVVFTVRVVQV